MSAGAARHGDDLDTSTVQMTRPVYTTDTSLQVWRRISPGTPLPGEWSLIPTETSPRPIHRVAVDPAKCPRRCDERCRRAPSYRGGRLIATRPPVCGLPQRAR